MREDTNLEPAFWGQFPGNEAYLVRRAMISTANMASFGSLHGFALGQAEGNHWGDAVTLLETTSATPFFFNFHHGDLGNFSVIGPSGSGKTVVMNFLAAQAQKFSPRTVLFDKDRGAELFIRGIGGRYDRIRAGEPTGFNPLALPDNAGQPRVPARLARRAAQGRGARGAGDDRRRGRRGLRQRCLAAPAAHLPRAALGRAPPAAGRPRRPPRARGSRTASSAGCSTTPTTGSTCPPACWAST